MTDLVVYIDFKSPYAYLAVAPIEALEDELGITFDWRPYTLDIPAYLGSAEVGPDGQVLAENRNPHQWRRVRYSYMDVRRYANLRGLTVRGPQKIWDSSLANIGLLAANSAGRTVRRAYVQGIYEPFWKRQLDIEDVAVVQRVLAAADGPADGFSDFAAGAGRAEHDRIREEAHDIGIFGVPTIRIDDEIFWGREHLDLVRARLTGQTPHEEAGLRQR